MLPSLRCRTAPTGGPTSEQSARAGNLRLPQVAGSCELGTVRPTPLPLWITLAGAPLQTERRDYSTVAWAPELDFWPQLKAQQLEALMPVNDFLLRRRGLLPLVPAKERSLEIFGDEAAATHVPKRNADGQAPAVRSGLFSSFRAASVPPAAAPGRPSSCLKTRTRIGVLESGIPRRTISRPWFMAAARLSRAQERPSPRRCVRCKQGTLCTSAT